MSKITESARGEACTVRLPNICSQQRNTVIFAHYRLAGTCGMGIKPPDYLGAYACSACHDTIDGRTQHIDKPSARLAHAEGVMRTLTLSKAKDAYD